MIVKLTDKEKELIESVLTKYVLCCLNNSEHEKSKCLVLIQVLKKLDKELK